MARGRMISKSWSTSKKRAALYRTAGALAEFCLQLFPLIVVHSDDYGRLDGDAETIKLKCDPGSPRSFEEFEQALELLTTVGLIQRYRLSSDLWLQIIQFDEHQPGLLSKRTKPVSPAPPVLPEVPGNSGLTKPNLTEPNLTEPNLTENASAAADTATPDAPQGPVEARRPVSTPFLQFPVVGSADAPTWTLSVEQCAEWVALYPGLDVRGEARKALAWVRADPTRRKTARGMTRFLVGWLSRAVDAGRARQPVTMPQSRAGHQPFACPHTPPCTDGRLRCYQRTHGIGVAR